MIKKALGIGLLVLGLMFPLACAHRKAVMPTQPTAEKATVQTQSAQPQPQVVNVPQEEKAAKLKEQQISEEELARQKQEAAEKTFKEEISKFESEDIYFDFDKYNIRPDAASVLEKKAEWLKAHPNVKVLIEGHCDEWGSEDYNLALGERRANSVKEFLINLGVNPEQLSTISYGEEKPAVTPPAYCETVKRIMRQHGLRPGAHVPASLLPAGISEQMVCTCQNDWAKNRRCHFVVVQY